MSTTIPLTQLNLEVIGIIASLNCNENVKRRFLDLGIIPGTSITPVLRSIGGDPIAYEVRNTLISIRNQDAKNILVTKYLY